MWWWSVVAKFKVGTRRSALATTQTTQVIRELTSFHAFAEFEMVEIVTKGDRIQDVALAKVGGKGLFVSDIEAALLDKTIDFAVHSMKDVPAKLAPGLAIGAIPKREDPRDILITKTGETLHTLKQGAIVGTSSLRRAAQILALRPDLAIHLLRGNIDTRLQKLEHLDAVILAAAGLSRMGWWDGERFCHHGYDYQAMPAAVDDIIPAVGQGALAIECREGDKEVLDLLLPLHDLATAAAVLQERAFLDAVGGSCQVPVGALAKVDVAQSVSTLSAMIGVPDGSRVLKKTQQGDLSPTLGTVIAKELLDAGGRSILQTLSSVSE